MMREFDRKILEKRAFLFGEEWINHDERLQKVNSFLKSPLPCPKCWHPLNLIEPKIFNNEQMEDEPHIFFCELKCEFCGQIILGIGEAKIEEQNYAGENGYE